MADPLAVPVAPASARSASDSYVEWGAVIGGAVLASAISFVLLTFGGAIGLSLSSPYSGEGMSLVAFAVAAGLWLLWVQVSSFFAGGYLAGRMRRRPHDSTEHESDVRDGAHGLLVWATGVIVGAVLAAGGLGDAARSVSRLSETVAKAGDPSPMAPIADKLFRQAPGTAREPDFAARDAAMAVIAGEAVQGALSAEDKGYVVSIVINQTGASTAEAEQRVDAAQTDVSAAIAKAQHAADVARKTGVLVAFFVAASLMASAAAAYLAAVMGGDHRDKGVVLSLFALRR
jgi:hypothetical protein